MLQTIGTSNAAGCNPAKKKKIEDICECLDVLQCEIDENAANIQQNASDISELDDRVTSVENGNFTNVSTSGSVSTDVINPKTGTNVAVCANINTKNVTAENITACSISDSDGRTLQSVSDCATQAASLANQLDGRVNSIECNVNNLDADLQNYKNDLAACVSTSCVDAQSINVSDTVNADTVCANSIVSNEVNSTVVNTKTISADGELVLPSPMATPNDWYTITVPANWNIKLSGKYTTENNVDYTFSIEVAEGLVRWSSFNYDVFKDFSFDKTTKWAKLRLKASENIKYVATHYDGDNTDISIERSGDGYTSYNHIPEQNDGIVAYGWDDQETRYCFPGTFRAKYMEQDSVDVLEDLTVRHDIYTTSEWDPTGNTCCVAKGTDNQYLSYCDTGLECPTKPGETYTYPMWKTPVSCATDGKLEQSECLITEKAVSEYNGTVCDRITDPENPADVYPITNLGDTSCVHGSIEVECNIDVHCDIVNTADHCVCVGDKLIAKCGIVSDSDVHIGGDLYVDGTTHVVQEETVTTESNTIVLRENASTGLAANDVSGVVVNKYDGTNDISLVTDCTGTLRVGTGTGTDTCYPTICYNNTDHCWYINDVVTAVTGSLTSYATKSESAPYTIYTDAVFTVIDLTSLEPIMTRDEESAMTDKGLVYWDATNTKGKTSCCWTFEDNGNQLIGGNNIVLDADQQVVSATNMSSSNACSDNVTVNHNLIQTDTNGCMFICGDLYVCGTTNIHGDVAGQVITQCNNNLDGFVSFVQCNHSGPSYSCIYTDECLKYNSASHILTVPTVCGNLCGNAATSNAVRDFMDSTHPIYVGWKRSEISCAQISAVAVYSNDYCTGCTVIKDTTKSIFKSWLSYGTAANLNRMSDATGVTYVPYNDGSLSYCLLTPQWLAYWNGAYNSNGASNLRYFCGGAFGSAAACAASAFRSCTWTPSCVAEAGTSYNACCLCGYNLSNLLCYAKSDNVINFDSVQFRLVSLTGAGVVIHFSTMQNVTAYCVGHAFACAIHSLTSCNCAKPVMYVNSITSCWANPRWNWEGYADCYGSMVALSTLASKKMKHHDGQDGCLRPFDSGLIVTGVF